MVSIAPGVVVRPDRVDDPVGREVACCHPAGITCGQPVGESLDALAQDGGASRAMNRAIRAAPAHASVRRIDNGVDLLLVMSPRTAVILSTQPVCIWVLTSMQQTALAGKWPRDSVRDVSGIAPRSSTATGGD